MSNAKRVRIFAGPNGSGKSTLKELIAPKFKVGTYINADEILVSFLADLIRNTLLGKIDRFSFETVMSHPSKIEFIKKAKNEGYKVYLYFVSLSDSDLNVRRVQTRVLSGGHNVAADKVRSRYDRTMELLFDAIKLADSVYLFDNSASKPQLFAKKRGWITQNRRRFCSCMVSKVCA